MKMNGKEVPLNGTLLLQPFPHQVGGHSGVLRYNDTTLCKPLISREQHFYETIPDDLLEYTAQFRGLLDVTIKQDADGKPLFIAHPADVSAMRSREVSRDDLNAIQLHAPKDIASDTAANEAEKEKEQAMGSNEDAGMLDLRQLQLMIKKSASGNPWALYCYQAQLARLSTQPTHHKFILLENLIVPYSRPCILDLKMGTRIHGDDASEEKKQRQKIKCQMSTSSTLGFYIGGMQVYHADSGSYLCYDKYEGRGLDVAGVRNALYQFFSNGQHVLAAVVRATIERLRRLEAVLARKNTFRFYSSSLLLMYDAGLCGPRGSCDDDDATDADIGCSSSSSIHSHTQPHHSQQQQQVNGVGVKAKKVSRQRGSSVLWSRHKFDKSPTMANRSMSETQLCKSSAALESLPGNAQRGASIEPTSPKASGGAHSKNGGSAANDDHRHKPLAASSSQQDVRFDVGSSEDDTPSPSTVPKPALPQSPQLLMTRQQPQPPMDSIAEGRGSVEGSFSSQPSSRQNSESHYVPTSPLTSSSSFASSGPFRVDVKMIDFAHVTYSGFHATDELHSGPDHGYLFGLDNLVSMLNQLLIADND